jgi:XisH protein
MAARDLYYDLVKNALRKDGWRITHNPLRLRLPTHDTQTGQGEAAEESLLGAEKDERKIAVVVKSFVDRGAAADLQRALEHLRLYHTRLHATAPDHTLYLAVRQTTYRDYFTGASGAQLLASHPTLFLVFDPRTEAIVNWNGLSPA